MNRCLNEIYQSLNVEYIHTGNFNYEEYKKIMKNINVSPPKHKLEP